MLGMTDIRSPAMLETILDGRAVRPRLRGGLASHPGDGFWLAEVRRLAWQWEDDDPRSQPDSNVIPAMMIM